MWNQGGNIKCDVCDAALSVNSMLFGEDSPEHPVTFSTFELTIVKHPLICCKYCEQAVRDMCDQQSAEPLPDGPLKKLVTKYFDSIKEPANDNL